MACIVHDLVLGTLDIKLNDDVTFAELLLHYEPEDAFYSRTWDLSTCDLGTWPRSHSYLAKMVTEMLESKPRIITTGSNRITLCFTSDFDLAGMEYMVALDKRESSPIMVADPMVEDVDLRCYEPEMKRSVKQKMKRSIKSKTKHPRRSTRYVAPREPLILTEDNPFTGHQNFNISVRKTDTSLDANMALFKSAFAKYEHEMTNAFQFEPRRINKAAIKRAIRTLDDALTHSANMRDQLKNRTFS